MVANVYRKLSENVAGLRAAFLPKFILGLLLAFAVGVAGVSQAYAHERHHHHKRHHHHHHHHHHIVV